MCVSLALSVNSWISQNNIRDIIEDMNFLFSSRFLFLSMYIHRNTSQKYSISIIFWFMKMSVHVLSEEFVDIFEIAKWPYDEWRNYASYRNWYWMPIICKNYKKRLFGTWNKPTMKSTSQTTREGPTISSMPYLLLV